MRQRVSLMNPNAVFPVDNRGKRSAVAVLVEAGAGRCFLQCVPSVERRRKFLSNQAGQTGIL